MFFTDLLLLLVKICFQIPVQVSWPFRIIAFIYFLNKGEEHILLKQKLQEHSKCWENKYE